MFHVVMCCTCAILVPKSIGHQHSIIHFKVLIRAKPEVMEEVTHVVCF